MSNDALHVLLVWATLLGGMGCSSTSQATSTSVLRPDIGEVPAELQRDYEVFAHNCSKCHDVDRALTAPVTDNHHWEMYVAKMMRTPGSGIQKLEAPHILRFLFWYTDRKAGRVEMGQITASESPAQPVSSPEPPPPAAAPLLVEPAPVEPTKIQGESTP